VDGLGGGGGGGYDGASAVAFVVRAASAVVVELGETASASARTGTSASTMGTSASTTSVSTTTVSTTVTVTCCRGPECFRTACAVVALVCAAGVVACVLLVRRTWRPQLTKAGRAAGR
jgi:hypothetical protein